MASCQTWASSSHIRHPWFDTTVTKRKLRDLDDADVSPTPTPAPSPNSRPLAAIPGAFQAFSSSSSSNSASPPRITTRGPPAKRRRCSPIENGFAHLSLSSSPAPPQQQQQQQQQQQDSAYLSVQELPPSAYPYAQPPAPVPVYPPAYVPEAPMDLDAPQQQQQQQQEQQQQQAYTVEEPRTSPDALREEQGRAPEVAMRGPPAWYEPSRDRIVITDLDAYSAEDEDEERARRHAEAEAQAREQAHFDGVRVNEALLARIRGGQRVAPPRGPPPSEVTSRALVLFRPLPLSSVERAGAEEAQAERRARIEAARVAQAQAQAQAQMQWMGAGMEGAGAGAPRYDDDAMDVE